MADYVISTSGSAAVSLYEARRHLNVSSTEDDQWITDAISAATRYVEDRTGQKYIRQSRRLTMKTFHDDRYVHGRRIYPRFTPIYSSTTVSIMYVSAAGTTTTLPTSDYIVSQYDSPSRISEAYNATWPDTKNHENDVTVNYTAGVSSVPQTVKHAINMLVAHWYRSREAATDRTFTEIPIGVDALLGPEQVEHYG